MLLLLAMVVVVVVVRTRERRSEKARERASQRASSGYSLRACVPSGRPTERRGGGTRLSEGTSRFYD